MSVLWIADNRDKVEMYRWLEAQIECLKKKIKQLEEENARLKEQIQ